MSSSIPLWGWILGGASVLGAAALIFWKREGIGVLADQIISTGKSVIFNLALTPQAQPYSDIILQVAQEKGMDPFIIAAIGQRESQWGAALRPPGPGGTGDFTPRTWTPTPLPPDGLGWGRGIMQLDYYYYSAWLNSHNWGDPYTNVAKGIDVLKQKIAFFSSNGSISGITDGSIVTLSANAAAARGVPAGQYVDPRPLQGGVLTQAAIAAYNGGEANILMSIASGVDPDTTTAGGAYGAHNYAADVMSRATTMLNSFTELA